jgi:hypothetical protein
VDDEGVDLVFHRRGGTSTLAVQVKARMTDSKQLADGTFRANVRTVSLSPRPDLYVLFVRSMSSRGHSTSVGSSRATVSQRLGWTARTAMCS